MQDLWSSARQQPTAAAEEQLPSGFRYVNGVALWGDSDGWPRTAEELELGRALWFSGREADALSIFDRALGELDAPRRLIVSLSRQR